MIAFSLLLMLVFGSHGVATAAPFEGFRGIPWGADLAAWQHELVLVETDGAMQYYARTGDKLAIGEATLLKVRYGFYHGKFAMVFITYTGLQNFLRIKEALVQTYGPATQPNRFLDRYVWALYGPVTRYLSYTSGLGQGHVLFQDAALRAQQEADARRQGKAAGKDF